MKYLILGAGPAGLSFAQALRDCGCTDFLVLEAEKEAGGLCRSVYVDGYELDIGGGHFLDMKRADVLNFLLRFIPFSEWNCYKRDSQIEIFGSRLHHPFEANIWELPAELQNRYLDSIRVAGCNTAAEEPKFFTNWIRWKLGDAIADDYMIPYNQKIFGSDLDMLGTYWLDKLPNVSYEETLISCKEHHAHGKQPGHTTFLYPKRYGYGELWRRMADSLFQHVKYNKKVDIVDFDNRTVHCLDGSSYTADRIIVTVPWVSFCGYPEWVDEYVKKLRYSSITVDYYGGQLNTSAQWVYYPDSELSYHRILVRHNFSAGRGYWTETNSERVKETSAIFTYRNEYAYPENTVDKPIAMKELLTYAESKSFYGLGRWGEWEHYNSDVVVMRAVNLANKLEG